MEFIEKNNGSQLVVRKMPPLVVVEEQMKRPLELKSFPLINLNSCMEVINSPPNPCCVPIRVPERELSSLLRVASTT